MSKPVILACVIVVLLGPAAANAEACACVLGPIPPGLSADARREFIRGATRDQVRRRLDDAYAIFSGEVIAVADGWARFRLEEAWKGDLPKEFSMASGGYHHADGSITISSCDYAFKAGVKYLVFATASPTRNMEADKCSPTGELEFNRDVVAMLNELAANRPKK